MPRGASLGYGRAGVSAPSAQGRPEKAKCCRDRPPLRSIDRILPSAVLLGGKPRQATPSHAALCRRQAASVPRASRPCGPRHAPATLRLYRLPPISPGGAARALPKVPWLLGGCELYFHRFQGKGKKQGVKPGWVALVVSFSLVKQAIAVEHSPLASATLTTPSGSRFVPEVRPAKPTSTPLNKGGLQGRRRGPYCAPRRSAEDDPKVDF
jgi:hypothetical protein